MSRERLRRYEPHDGCTNMKLRALVAVNGARQFAIWCMTPDQYGRRRRGAFIPHHIVADYLTTMHMILDDVPVIQDNSCEQCNGSGCEACCPYACERCGSYSRVEWHHWAPRYLFDDADSWPTAYLCRECHRRWHSTVTPSMHLRRAG